MKQKIKEHHIFLIVLILFLPAILLFTGCSDKASDFLSDEDRLWLDENDGRFDTLFGYQAPPNVYHNDKGENEGLLVDFNLEIEKVMGMKFNFRDFTTWDELLEYSKTAENFVIVGIARTDERETYLSFTNSFIKVPFVIITRKNSGVKSMNDLSGKTICTTKNYAVNDYLAENYPGFPLAQVADDLIGLRGVSAGKWDAMIVNQMYGTYIIEQQGITNLDIAGESGYYNRLAAATSQKNPKLFNILDQAVSQISPARQREIYSDWVFAVKQGISRKLITTIVFVVSLAGVVLILSWLYLVSLRARVKKNTMEIEESEHRYRSLVENSNDAIFLLYDKRLIMVNRKFQTLFGYSKKELLSPYFKFMNLIAPESRGEISKRLEYIETAVPVPESFEITGFSKSRKKLYLELSVSYLKLKDGWTSQGILHDVGERKKREKALVRAMEQAEESDKLKSAFLANLSHEIRTPMNGILGFADLLGKPDITEIQKAEYIKLIRKSGERMFNTLNDLIDISMIETGQIEIKNFEVNINEKLENICAFFMKAAEEKGVKLSYSVGLPFDDADICTDESKFESILTNLINNAIKYTEEGEIEIGYSTGDDGLLTFFVKDTGIGIPEDRFDAVFNRFEQAVVSDVKSCEGFGLGLSIAKSYALMLGGDIRLESKEGRGSTFFFSLPSENL